MYYFDDDSIVDRFEYIEYCDEEYDGEIEDFVRECLANPFDSVFDSPLYCWKIIKCEDYVILAGVVIPVSYGDKSFAEDIEKAATKQYGSSAKMLKDFMPLSEYNKVLESCDVFIYGHYRQEAVGNILIALYLGGKVFLYNYNPLLGFYKSIGLTIFSIEDDLNSDSVNTKLHQSEILNNKRIIEDYYSEEKLLQLTKESFA